MDAVTKTITDSFIRQLQDNKKLPWEAPYLYHNAFGYMSEHLYTGINRWLVPFGEYFTKKGINDLNEQLGTDYKFAKGIKWYPILYYGDSVKEISADELPDEIRSSYNSSLNTPNRVQIASTYNGKIRYFEENGKIFKHTPVRKYYRVADRTHFVDSNGDCPESKLTRKLTITYEKPDSVADIALQRIGYTKQKDRVFSCDEANHVIHIADPAYCQSEWFYYFHLFRSIATATKNILRAGKNIDSMAEECICLVTAGLLCAETDVCDKQSTILDSNRKNYNFENWIEYFDNNRDKLIGIMYEADTAFKYILG